MQVQECCELRLHRYFYLVVSESMALSLKIGLDTQTNAQLLFDETSGQPALRIDFQIQILLSSLFAAITCLQSTAASTNQECESSSAIDIPRNLEANPLGTGNDNESTIHESDTSSATNVVGNWQHTQNGSGNGNLTNVSLFAEIGGMDSGSTDSTQKVICSSRASEHNQSVYLVEENAFPDDIANTLAETPYNPPTFQRKNTKVVNKSMSKAESALARLKGYETGDGEILSKWEAHITNSACPELETVRLIQMVEKLCAMGYCCVDVARKAKKKKGGYNPDNKKNQAYVENLQEVTNDPGETKWQDTDINFQTAVWQSFEVNQCQQTDAASDTATSSTQVYNRSSHFNGGLESNDACQHRFRWQVKYQGSSKVKQTYRRKPMRTPVRERADEKLAGQIHVAKKVIEHIAGNHAAIPPPPVDPPIPAPPADPPPVDASSLMSNKDT